MKVKEKLLAYQRQIVKNGSQFEKQVFDYLVAGYRFDEIAEMMQVDVKKIYNAKYRIQKKLMKSKSV